MKPTQLLDGVEQLINSALPVPPGPTGYKAKTTADNLSAQPPPSVNLPKLVRDLWNQIVVNWVEGGCQSRGEFNWRWKRNLTCHSANSAPEVTLQREIANFVGERWSNETPTGSGLSEGEGGEPGGLDLAYAGDDEKVVMIELKYGSNTPVSAAIQLVIYGLTLVLARTVHAQVPIATDKRWLHFKRADLRVLAPNAFYERYDGLAWFEHALDAAVRDFGAEHKLDMTFAFRCFGDRSDLKDEAAVLNQLGDAGIRYSL